MQQTFATSMLNKAGRSLSYHVKHAVRLQCQTSITQAAPPALSASDTPTSSRRLRKRQLTDQRGRVMLKNMPLPELESWCQQQGERRNGRRHFHGASNAQPSGYTLLLRTHQGPDALSRHICVTCAACRLSLQMPDTSVTCRSASICASGQTTRLCMSSPDANPGGGVAVAAGESPKRALQLWRWMYSDDLWIKRVEDTLAQQGGFSASFM